jgi:hypothetical protein
VAVNIANILDIRPTYLSNPEKRATIVSAAGAGDRIHAVGVQESFSAACATAFAMRLNVFSTTDTCKIKTPAICRGLQHPRVGLKRLLSSPVR